LLRFQTSHQQTGMIYNNTNTGFILRYSGAQQTYSQYLISFIITVLTKDIFHAMIAKMGFKVRPIMKIYI